MSLDEKEKIQGETKKKIAGESQERKRL